MVGVPPPESGAKAGGKPPTRAMAQGGHRYFFDLRVGVSWLPKRWKVRSRLCRSRLLHLKTPFAAFNFFSDSARFGRFGTGGGGTRKKSGKYENGTGKARVYTSSGVADT